MDKEYVRKILAVNGITVSDDTVNKLMINPCNYNYLLDILERYTTPFVAKITAQKIYGKCIGEDK